MSERANGGLIHGPSGPDDDSIPVLLSDGCDYALPKEYFTPGCLGTVNDANWAILRDRETGEP